MESVSCAPSADSEHCVATTGDAGTGAVRLTTAERQDLRRWARAGTTPQRVVTRARIVLLLDEGRSQADVARHLGVHPRTVRLWWVRYRAGGAASLWRDAPGRGRRPTISSDLRERALAVLDTPPPLGRHWTLRQLARALGVSTTSAHRLLTSVNGVGRHLENGDAG